MANSKSLEPSIVIYKRGIKESRLDWSLKEIEKQADAGASVLILERYGFHLPADGSGGGSRNFSDSDEYEYKWARLKEDFPTLSLTKLTIHSAKGLEADYSVIGLRGGLWGFPSQKVDDPLFDMVLTQADQFPNGEERRLFYVAITRARKKTYLVCETQPDQSVFAAELESGEEYPISVFGVDTEKLSCPECKSGVLLLRDGSNGNFYGCSNYSLCDYTEQTCQSCGEGLMISDAAGSCVCNLCGLHARLCPKCTAKRILGILRVKRSKFGTFYGCSNYVVPDIDCDYKEKVPVTTDSKH